MSSFLKLVIQGVFPNTSNKQNQFFYSFEDTFPKLEFFLCLWSDQYWRYWNTIIELEMSWRHFLIVQSISSFPIIWWLSHIRNMSKFQTRDEVQCSLSSNKNCCPLTIIASSIANWVLIMQFGLKSKWPCVIEQLFGSWTFFANASFKIYVKLQHVILQVS